MKEEEAIRRPYGVSLLTKKGPEEKRVVEQICGMKNILEIPGQPGVPAGHRHHPVLVGIGAWGVR